MKILLKQLSITNFKGIKHLVVNFSHITNIYGENGAGKTTILDAFSWLFWGKDSTDRKDFEIQPLDKSNKLIPKIDVEVSAIIEVDGVESTVKKVLREKWVQKRGQAEQEKAGNETTYFWNDVPMKLVEFQAKIDQIIKENLFKLITNTLYFNSMKWQDRRTALMSIAGTITDADIAAQNPEFVSLLSMLTNKTMDEFKRELAARKKKMKDELDPIQSRIDEVQRSKPQPVDFPGLKITLDHKLEEVVSIENTLIDSNKAQSDKLQSVRDKQTEVHNLKRNQQTIESNIRSSFNQQKLDRERAIANEKNTHRLNADAIAQNGRHITAIMDRREMLIKEQNDLRAKWGNIDAEKLVFDEGQFCCPSCKRALEESDIEAKKAELTKNFNADKVARLKTVTDRGLELKGQLEAIDQKAHELSELNKELTAKNDLIAEQIVSMGNNHEAINLSAESEIQKMIQEDQDYLHAGRKIAQLEQEIESIMQGSTATNEVGDLKQRKLTLQVEIDDLRKLLAREDQIAKADQRIEELASQEIALGQQIAELEGTEFLIQQFTKAKIELIQQRINGRFKYVKFRMFETQINGAEVECCDTLVDGVPFSDANNAAKINAGLDIINTLCEHHNVYAPIFIDNRESVNQLIDSNSQIINLIVSMDQQLKVA